jgi:mono/diheme cytochrome c family protein
MPFTARIISLALAGAAFALLIVGTYACSDDAAGASTASPAAQSEARQIFSSRCTPCHGSEGAGDGTVSRSLTPPPRNFQDPTWQGSVQDDHIDRIIQYGGAAVGKSPGMPANPDLQAKPEVVAALREHIRSLRR